MAILKRIIILTLLPIFLTGCFSDFDPKIGDTPVLCMNSQIVPGDSLSVSLTRTWRWDEGLPDELDLTIKDAEVKLFVNGEYKENLIFRETRVEPHYYPYKETVKYEYVGNYIPKSGDEIKLVAVSPEYGEAWAVVKVPEPVAIDKVEYTVTEFEDVSYEDAIRANLSMDFQVWFTDPADKVNYYEFDSRVINRYYSDWESNNGGWVNVQCFMDFDREPLFTEHLSALEHVGADSYGYTFFSDRQIAGKSYPLHIGAEYLTYVYKNPNNDSSIPDPELKFTLKSLSDSYYNHILSVWVANDGIVGSLGSVGLGDAVFASSNVSTKAGVVAAYAPVSVSLNLREIVDEEIKNKK